MHRAYLRDLVKVEDNDERWAGTIMSAAQHDRHQWRTNPQQMFAAAMEALEYALEHASGHKVSVELWRSVFSRFSMRASILHGYIATADDLPKGKAFDLLQKVIVAM